MIHDMYLLEVKAQADSKYPWDYYKLVAKVPGEQAFLSPAEVAVPAAEEVSEFDPRSDRRRLRDARRWRGSIRLFHP